MSKLLFNTHPLVIDPDLAKLIGLNESIILQQIHYWIELNRKADKNLRDGFTWTYNSYEDWQKQFPFWSMRTIQRTITGLETKGLLITGNFNRMGFDRTKWYRIDYERLETLIECPLGQIGTMDDDKLALPIPETISETHFYDDSRAFSVAKNRRAIYG
jgi:hypothetical protein